VSKLSFSFALASIRYKPGWVMIHVRMVAFRMRMQLGETLKGVKEGGSCA